MSRARMLKPGFFENDELAELPIAARMLFAGLWTLADREGRLEDRPKRIKAALFPYDDLDVDDLLDGLSGKGFVHRYEADGVRCIEVVNFRKHQRPHHNESASTLPPRPEGLATMDESASLLNLSLEPRTLNISLEPSLDLSGEPERESDSDSSDETDDVPPRRGPKPNRSAHLADFEARFYGPYPKHVGKEAAFKAWLALKASQRDAAATALAAWLEAAAFSPELQFVPNPATWLNGKRWTDDLAAVCRAPAAPTTKTRVDVARDKLAYLESGPDGWSVADRDRYKGAAGRVMLDRDLAVYRGIVAGEAA